MGPRSEVTSAAGGHERLYRGLLRLYPADYRARFEEQQVQLFSDQKRATGATRAWLRAPVDVITTAASEHLRRNRTMANSLTLEPTPVSRVLGLLGVFGGAFLLSGFIGLNGWTPDAFNLRLLVFNVGAIAIAIGVHMRQSSAGGAISLIAAALVIIANAVYMAFILNLVARPGELGPGDYQPIDSFTLATAAMWLCDAWFGVVTFRLGVMSRWSALALVVGSVILFLGIDRFGLAPVGSLAEKVLVAGVVVHGLAWILLGIEVALRRRRVPPAAAA